MTTEQQRRIIEMISRYEKLEDDMQVKDDFLWLLQMVELQATQIEILCAPEHVRALMKRFGELTQTRKTLILELMREMKESSYDQQS